MASSTRTNIAAGVIAAIALSFCLAVGLHVQLIQPHPGDTFLDPNTNAPRGTVYKRFYSKTINGEANYLIYLPPGYEQGNRRYPVVYWLHGLNDSPRVGGDFVARIDAAIKSVACPPMIVVLPNGHRDYRYYDSKDGTVPVESVIMKDLLPHIDATYRTIATREGRAIEGFSVGGFGAVRFGFKYPELFCAITSVSGAIYDEVGIRGQPGGPWTRAHFQKVFGGDAEYYRVTSPQVLAEKNRDAIQKIKIRLYIGGKDGLMTPTDRFRNVLQRLEIQFTYTVIPNLDHDQKGMYDAIGSETAAFYRDLFKSPG